MARCTIRNKNPEQILGRLAKSIRFRGYCRLHGLPELPKCMEAMTNNKINITETTKREKALSNKVWSWSNEKIKKSRSKTFLLAVIYIMIKTLVIDKSKIQGNTLGGINNTKEQAKTDIQKLVNYTGTDANFMGCESLPEKVNNVNEKFFTKYINELVDKMNKNNLHQLTVLEKKEDQQSAGTQATKPTTAQKPRNAQKKHEYHFLLPPEGIKNEFYMKLYNHPNKENAYLVTKVTWHNNGYTNSALIPDFSNIKNVDQEDLEHIRLAIEKLKTARIGETIETTKTAYLSEKIKEVSLTELNSKVLDPALREIEKRAQVEFTEENSQPPTAPKKQKDILNFILPYSQDSTKYRFQDYVKDLFKRGNSYYGTRVRHFPGKSDDDDDYPVILIPDFATIPDHTLKKYEEAIGAIKIDVEKGNPPRRSVTGEAREYSLSNLKEVEYKELNNKVLQPALDRINKTN